MKGLVKIKNIIILGVIVIVLIGSFTIVKINPGYVGLQYSLNGGLRDEVLTQGLKFKSPIVKVIRYPISRQQVYLSKDSREGSKDDESFLIPTKVGKTISVDLEFSYKFDSELLSKTYAEFRGAEPKYIEDTFIRAKMKTWSGEVSSKFAIIDIYGDKRTELNQAVLDYVQPKFLDYGILIDGVSFTQIRLDEQTAQAIQNKVNKQQEVESAKLELEKQKIENQRNVEAAQAEAEQIRIKAQAEADANKTLANSVTDQLIKLKEVEARDKHGWITVTGANSTAVVNGN